MSVQLQDKLDLIVTALSQDKLLPITLVVAKEIKLLLMVLAVAHQAKSYLVAHVLPQLLAHKTLIKFQPDKLAQPTKFWTNIQDVAVTLLITLITKKEFALLDTQLATVLNGWLLNKVNSMVSQFLGVILIVTPQTVGQLVYILLAVLSYIKPIQTEPPS